MFKYLTALGLACFLLSSCDVFEALNEEELPEETQHFFPVEINGKWGYIDINGTIVIEPTSEYRNADYFFDGRAIVRTLDAFRIINEQGEYITDNKFYRIESFSEGLAPFYYARRWGYLNRDGEVEIIPQYGGANEFINGMALVDNLIDPPFYITKNGNEIHPPDSSTFSITSNESYDNSRLTIRKGRLFGYANQSGEIVIEPRFLQAREFNEGLACVYEQEEYKYIDRAGNDVLTLGENACSSFSGNRAFVRDTSGLWAIIDKEGTMLTDFKYSSNSGFSNNIEPFRYNRAVVSFGVPNEIAVIDRNGNIILRGEYDLFQNPGKYVNGLLRVRVRNSREDGIGYIDTTGNYVWYPSQ